LRRAATSQEFDIQLETPKRGNTHFMSAKYAARRMMRTMDSDIWLLDAPWSGMVTEDHRIIDDRGKEKRSLMPDYIGGLPK
jgi:hypothetical protein